MKVSLDMLCSEDGIYVFAAVTIGGPIGYFITRPANPDFLSIIVGFAVAKPNTICT